MKKKIYPLEILVLREADGGSFMARESGMSRDPFRIEGPALVSFSGGRTSGYMLRRILDAGLQEGVFVVFADTQKERPETYEFVREVERRWDVNIVWRYRSGGFEGLIEDKQMPPNTVRRFCTQHLKLVPIWDFALKYLGWEHWTSVIGIRADEPRRIAKIRGRKPMKFEEVCLPLADAGITERDVLQFWGGQPFDLKLRSWEGNCDLCFLKGQNKRVRIMQDNPELAQWWIDQEAKTAGFFRAPPRPNYAELFRRSQLPMLFDPEEEEDLADCICGD